VAVRKVCREFGGCARCAGLGCGGAGTLGWRANGVRRDGEDERAADGAGLGGCGRRWEGGRVGDDVGESGLRLGVI